jgi:hypothetical protein
MKWVLRPFIGGDPSQPTGFFRDGAWSSAYVEIVELAWAVLTRELTGTPCPPPR